MRRVCKNSLKTASRKFVFSITSIPRKSYSNAVSPKSRLWPEMKDVDAKLRDAYKNKKTSIIIEEYSKLLEKLDDNYNVTRGTVTMYHGNAYNANNREIHTLEKPARIYTQRVDDVMTAWRDKLDTESKSHRKKSFDVDVNIAVINIEYTLPIEDGFIVPPKIFFGMEEDARFFFVSFEDIGHRNAPVEYEFELTKKNPKF